jgi:tRNA nucleotidyltransferase (CCA-adding enzyme)
VQVRYAVLTHDLGKAGTDFATWPKHHGHEAVSVRRAERVSERLRVPVEFRDLARLSARWHGIVHRGHELRPVKWLELLLAADALRRPQRLHELVQVCESDALSRPGAPATYAPGELVREALEVVQGVDAGGVATATIARASKRGATAGSEDIAKAVRTARLRALAAWRRSHR